MGEFDVLFISGEQRVEKFNFKGKEISVTVRELSWTEKNKVLGMCFQYKTSGDMSFDFDKYNKEMLLRIISGIKVGDSEVPPKELNHIFFTRLNSSFGGMLEKLVPKAFEEVGTSDFFEKGQSS